MKNNPTAEPQMKFHLLNLTILIMANLLLIIVCNAASAQNALPLETVVGVSNKNTDIQRLMGIEVSECKLNAKNPQTDELQKRILVEKIALVFPQAVKNENGNLMVDNEALTALTISGTQALFKMVIRVNSENADIQEDILKLKAENLALKQDIAMIIRAFQLEATAAGGEK